ncbi:hypothetical protein BDM02DRAFT_3182482 [Thelephora ganbajun]|uniref:Uncharacterized protein n=1 Tax=Thelephora ganbajun TaxID=370292 RepID=A0ACB6ZY91_THEGA|nr:hypothetical protein BDM02DRAFT_3182482 [Thelephora ganbajun]
MTSTEDLIAGLQDGLALDYYAVALTALYLYDYLLTFSDEVRYAWRGKKTWVFFLFLAIRYVPMGYRFWSLLQATWPGYTQELCNRTSFIHVLAFILGTWMAQAALAVRVYAITLKNLPITACLALLSTGQLGLGLYHTIIVILNPATPSQAIPQVPIHWCIISRHRAVEVTNTVFSIPFDIVIFIVTIYCAVKQSGTRWLGKGAPSLLRTLARDGALYFMVIFTSHIIYTFTLILGRPIVQVIPALYGLLSFLADSDLLFILPLCRMGDGCTLSGIHA